MPAPPRPLAPEVPVLLRVDGRDLTLLFCSPFDLDDLAVGHLVGRGLLPKRESLRSLFICDDRGRVDIDRWEGPPLPEGGVPVLASACGAGALPSEILGLGELAAAGSRPPVVPLFSLEELAGSLREMFATAVMHRETGGMHCAALVSAPGILSIVREDVGRHNAVDKVIGRGFLEGRDFATCAILSSGRIAADMVAKAIHAGVGLLVTRSIPTTSAFELACEFGLSIVGRALSSSPILYCDAGRIVPPKLEIEK